MIYQLTTRRSRDSGQPQSRGHTQLRIWTSRAASSWACIKDLSDLVSVDFPGEVELELGVAFVHHTWESLEKTAALFSLFRGTLWAIELALSWLYIFCLRLWMTHIALASLNVRLVSFPWSSKSPLLHLLLPAQTRYRQNNEAPHSAPLPGTDDLYFAPYVAAVRVLSSSSVSSSDQDRVGGAVRNPRTRLPLEKPHLSHLQSDLHHSWHRTSGKPSASYSKWSRKSISFIVTLNTANKLLFLQHKQNTGVWKEEENCNYTST